MPLVINPLTGELDVTGATGGGGPFQPLDADLTAIAALAGTGFAARTAADTWALRTFGVVDSASIDLTLTNGDGVAGNPSLTAVVLPAGVDHNSLANLTVGDPHTQYLLLAGRAGGQTAIGDTAASGNLSLQSTANATRGEVIVIDKLHVKGPAGNNMIVGDGDNSCQVTIGQQAPITGDGISTVLRVRSGAGAGEPEIYLNRAGTDVGQWIFNGTLNIFDLGGGFQLQDTFIGSGGTGKWTSAGLRIGDSTTATALLDVMGKGTVDSSGNLTMKGSTHVYGTAGTTCSLQVGKGTTGADNATLIVDCGNGGGVPTLKLQSNATDLVLLRSDATFGIGQFGSNAGIYQFYNDTTFTTVGYSINQGKNVKYAAIATEGIGCPAVYKDGITATQTGAVTVASYTPPATAGRYRVSVVITTTSATNTGTVGVTLDYRDSQGTTHTADPIPMHNQLATAIAATQTMAASKEWHTIPWVITINNAAIAIVVKTVITGAVSYTASATIEQLA